MNIDELRSLIETSKAQLKTELQKHINEEFAKYFEKYKELESFSWAQYTPYFNDGDTCTFSVHNDIYVNGENEYDCDWVDGSEWKNEFVKSVTKTINGVESDIMEEIFGEGLITVHRNGTIETEDYDHD